MMPKNWNYGKYLHCKEIMYNSAIWSLPLSGWLIYLACAVSGNRANHFATLFRDQISIHRVSCQWVRSDPTGSALIRSSYSRSCFRVDHLPLTKCLSPNTTVTGVHQKTRTENSHRRHGPCERERPKALNPGTPALRALQGLAESSPCLHRSSIWTWTTRTRRTTWVWKSEHETINGTVKNMLASTKQIWQDNWTHWHMEDATYLQQSLTWKLVPRKPMFLYKWGVVHFHVCWRRHLH